jgi:hypothetical protein
MIAVEDACCEELETSPVPAASLARSPLTRSIGGRFTAVDPGLVVDQGDHDAPDQPQNPDQPQSFAGWT